MRRVPLQSLLSFRGQGRSGQVSYGDFVAEHPGELMHLAKNTKNQVQIDAYIGRWMRVSAMTRDSSRKNTHVMVWTHDPPLVLNFEPSWNDRLASLGHGRKITVVGQIARITSFEVELGACRLA